MSNVRKTAGVLISCDIPTKQFILNLNTKRHFVLGDLDATHVFVEASAVQEIKDLLEELHERNVYIRPR